MEYVKVTKEEYALQVLELAKENHIWINAMWERDSNFFERLGRMVYKKLDEWRKLDSISFWSETNLKLPWSMCFISLNQS